LIRLSKRIACLGNSAFCSSIRRPPLPGSPKRELRENAFHFNHAIRIPSARAMLPLPGSPKRELRENAFHFNHAIRIPSARASGFKGIR
jgi:hypothetical protein